MFIVFEGLDKSGKGTLERELLKETNFKHIVIDRGPAGYLTFDEIFGRNTLLGDIEFLNLARVIRDSEDYLVVYCTADKSIVDERLKEHNETCPYDYKKAQKLYQGNVRKYYDPRRLVEIDTSALPIKTCVLMIIEKLSELRRL